MSPVSLDATCQHCKHYHPFGDDLSASGSCHLNPPSVIRASETPMWAWPPVKNTDWCGSFAVIPDAGPVTQKAATPVQRGRSQSESAVPTTTT
jgi:hypothetical protein